MRTERPQAWREVRREASLLMLPFHWLNWSLSWVSYALSHWALLDVLEHLGVFSVLAAVIFYFAESGDRLKQKHYQAWQVINTAQGKGGNGGRIDALQELNHDHVSLVGVDASGAFLQGIHLENAHLERCKLDSADVRNGDLRYARLSSSNLESTNFRQADMSGADLSNADLQNSDFNQANLQKANLEHADLSGADLRYTDVQGSLWRGIGSLKLANVYGIRNASSEFIAYARSQGAVSIASDDDWNALLLKQSSREDKAAK